MPVIDVEEKRVRICPYDVDIMIIPNPGYVAYYGYNGATVAEGLVQCTAICTS